MDSTTWIQDSRNWIPDSLSVELRFWIPIVSGIPDSTTQISWIPASTKQIFKTPDSTSKIFPYSGIPIPLYGARFTCVVSTPTILSFFLSFYADVSTDLTYTYPTFVGWIMVLPSLKTSETFCIWCSMRENQNSFW